MYETLINACCSGNLDVVLNYIKKGENMCAANNISIRMASENGHEIIVQELLKIPEVDPGAFANSAIIFSAMNGHVNVVKLLLADSRVNPCEDNNRALLLAAWKNRFDVIELLLSDTRVVKNRGLDIAIHHIVDDTMRDKLQQMKYRVGGEKFLQEREIFKDLCKS